MKRPALQSLRSGKQLSEVTFSKIFQVYEETWFRLDKNNQIEFFQFLSSVSFADQEKIVLPCFMNQLKKAVSDSQIVFLQHCFQEPCYLKSFYEWVKKNRKKPEIFQELLDSFLSYMGSISKSKKENKKKFDFCLSFLGLIGQGCLKVQVCSFENLFLKIVSVLYSHVNQINFYDMYNLMNLLGETSDQIDHSDDLLKKILMRYGASVLNSSFQRYQKNQTRGLVTQVCALNFQYFFRYEELQRRMTLKTFRAFFYRAPEVCSEFLVDLGCHLSFSSLNAHLFLILMGYLVKSCSMIRQKKFAFFLIQPLRSYSHQKQFQITYPDLFSYLEEKLRNLEAFCQNVEEKDFELLDQLSHQMENLNFSLFEQGPLKASEVNQKQKDFEKNVAQSFAENFFIKIET
jgi:hypothetical protein